MMSPSRLIRLALIAAPMLCLSIVPANAGDWLRAFATVEFEPTATISIPAAYESVLEQDVRREIEMLLAEQGYEFLPTAPKENAADRVAGYTISFSAEVVDGARRGLPKSPIQLGDGLPANPGASNRHKHRLDNGLTTGIVLGAPSRSELRGPIVDLTIYVLDGDTRVWSGYAQGSLNDATRSNLAKAMTQSLLKHFAKDALDENANFEPTATAWPSGD